MRVRTKIRYATLVAVLLLALFYPSSSNSVIFGSSEVVVYYSISLLFILFVVIQNRINVKMLLIFIATILLLLLSSYVSISVLGAELSIARVAPVVLTFIVLSLKFQSRVQNFHIMKRVLEIATIIIIIINIMTLLNIQLINDFIIDNYSQFNFYTVSYSLSQGKPIFTFGAHTFASFYYFFIFLLWLITHKSMKKKEYRYLFYMIALIVFTYLLNSVSAYIFSVIMLILMFTTIRKLHNRILTIIISSLVFIFAIYLEIIPINFELFFGNEAHGFIPRYLSNSIFTTNFEIIQKTVLGIGFTIPRQYNIVYTDSGYIVYSTMGTLYLTVVMYMSLWLFLKRNLNKYNWTLLIVILLFEFAIPSLIYIKTIMIIIFATEYLQMLEKIEMEETNAKI